VSPATAVRFFRTRFRELGSPVRAKGERAYMKSTLLFHGVTASQLRAAAADFCKEHRDLSRADLVAIVDALYETDWFDLRSVGVVLLERKRALLEARDLPWLIELVRRSGNWAQVDYLATKIVGDVVTRHARLLRELPRWAKDEDFWVRRTALLAQLGTLRRGGGDFALFARLAAGMLHEREFFIRKAIGWVLREVSKKRPGLVVEFLRENGQRASGVTLREARKYLRAAGSTNRACSSAK
jgi:3-methyladenine DNA glycosylase AlkD